MIPSGSYDGEASRMVSGDHFGSCGRMRKSATGDLLGPSVIRATGEGIFHGCVSFGCVLSANCKSTTASASCTRTRSLTGFPGSPAATPVKRSNVLLLL